MRKLTLGISTALLCCGAGIALAQIAPTMRPAPVTVSPRAMQAAAGSDVYQAQIDQLKAQNKALSQQLAQLNQQLTQRSAATDGEIKDLQSVSGSINGRLVALDKQFQGHTHYFQTEHVTLDNKHSLAVVPTSMPSKNCISTGYKGTAKTLSTMYNCTAP